MSKDAQLSSVCSLASTILQAGSNNINKNENYLYHSVTYVQSMACLLNSLFITCTVYFIYILGQNMLGNLNNFQYHHNYQSYVGSRPPSVDVDHGYCVLGVRGVATRTASSVVRPMWEWQSLLHKVQM